MNSISRTQGFSLIEAMVSLFLVALLLFGLDATQLYALKESENAYFFSMALNQINNGTERLIALDNLDNLNNLENLISHWNTENQSVLPAGFGTITGHYPNYILTVYWGSGCLRKKIQLA